MTSSRSWRWSALAAFVNARRRAGEGENLVRAAATACPPDGLCAGSPASLGA